MRRVSVDVILCRDTACRVRNTVPCRDTPWCVRNRLKDEKHAVQIAVGIQAYGRIGLSHVLHIASVKTRPPDATYIAYRPQYPRV